MTQPNQPFQGQDEFLAQAGHQHGRSLLAELGAFLSENRLWWMAPILIVLGLIGVLLVLGTTGALPFIYGGIF